MYNPQSQALSIAQTMMDAAGTAPQFNELDFANIDLAIDSFALDNLSFQLDVLNAMIIDRVRAGELIEANDLAETANKLQALIDVAGPEFDKLLMARITERTNVEPLDGETLEAFTERVCA